MKLLKEHIPNIGFHIRNNNDLAELMKVEKFQAHLVGHITAFPHFDDITLVINSACASTHQLDNWQSAHPKDSTLKFNSSGLTDGYVGFFRQYPVINIHSPAEWCTHHFKFIKFLEHLHKLYPRLRVKITSSSWQNFPLNSLEVIQIVNTGMLLGIDFPNTGRKVEELGCSIFSLDYFLNQTQSHALDHDYTINLPMMETMKQTIFGLLPNALSNLSIVSPRLGSLELNLAETSVNNVNGIIKAFKAPQLKHLSLYSEYKVSMVDHLRSALDVNIADLLSLLPQLETLALSSERLRVINNWRVGDPLVSTSLEELHIRHNSTITSINGIDFTCIRRLELDGLGSLLQINTISQSPTLEVLKVHNCSYLSSLMNFYLPSLRRMSCHIQASEYGLVLFSHLNFPKLTHLDLKVQSLKFKMNYVHMPSLSSLKLDCQRSNTFLVPYAKHYQRQLLKSLPYQNLRELWIVLPHFDSLLDMSDLLAECHGITLLDVRCVSRASHD